LILRKALHVVRIKGKWKKGRHGKRRKVDSIVQLEQGCGLY